MQRIWFFLSFISIVILVNCIVMTPFSGDQVIFFANLNTLSTPHPPGYVWNSLISFLGRGLEVPQFLILVQSCTFILCFTCLRRILEIEKIDKTLSALVPTFWFFSFGVFRYFLIYEARALTLALSCLYFWSLSNYLRNISAGNRWFLLGSCTLACSQHHLLYPLILPSLLVALLWKEKLTRLKVGLNVAVVIAIAFLPTFLLPLITQSHTINIFSWGNIQSINGLFKHWSRAEFGIFSLANIPSQDDVAAIFKHCYEFILFLFKASLGTVLLLIFPVAEKRSCFERLLYLSIFSYLSVLFLLGSIDPEDSWYHAILLRFWILPTPAIFLLIGFQLQRLSKKWLWSKYILWVFLAINFIFFIPAEGTLSQKNIYLLHSEIMANKTPEGSLVIHTTWIEWMRTLLWFNEKNGQKVQNSYNRSTHLSARMIFSKAWAQEQLVAQFNRDGYQINENGSKDRFAELVSAIKPTHIVLVGPKNVKELNDSTKVYHSEIEPIGPYFLLVGNEQDKELDRLREIGVKQCRQLFQEYLINPTDKWIEPIRDYFCYPCLLTYKRSQLGVENQWKNICEN